MIQVEFATDLIKAENESDELILNGCASTTDRDMDGDAMTPQALADMAKSAIGLPLVTSHNHEGLDEFGDIVDAHVEDNKLYIKAKLRKEHPYSKYAFDEVKQHPGKYGYSIYGQGEAYVKNGTRFIKAIRTMKHIAFTSKAKCPNTFAVAVAKALVEAPETALIKADSTSEDHVCASCSKHIEEPMKTENTELEKAGAMFSAASKDALKDIHDAGNADVKSKVRALLGDDAVDLLGPEVPELADGDADDAKEDGKDAIGVVAGKAQVEPAPVVQKIILDADAKSELAKLVKSAMAEYKPEPKVEVIEETTNAEVVRSMLRKALGGN